MHKTTGLSLSSCQAHTKVQTMLTVVYACSDMQLKMEEYLKQERLIEKRRINFILKDTKKYLFFKNKQF